MNDSDSNQVPTRSVMYRTFRFTGLLAVLVIKLLLITAMHNRNISEVIYNGF